MAVGVGVVGEGHVELAAHRDQARHRERRRAIHPDLAVPVGGHEAEGRIDGVVHDRRVDAIALRDRLPEMHGGAAERIDADLDAGGLDQRHVDDIVEIGDIGADIVVAMDQRRFARLVVIHPRDALHGVFQIRVGALLDHAGRVGVGGPAMRRIVFVAAILRRIVRRRDHDAVGMAAAASLVVGEDRMRDDRRRRVAAVFVDHDLDAVGGKHFHRAGQRRLGQRVGVDADEQRPGQPGGLAIVADRLRGREDVVLVERGLQRRAAMAGGAERDALRWIVGVGLAGKIGGHEPRDVRQRACGDRLAWFWCRHVVTSSRAYIETWRICAISR